MNNNFRDKNEPSFRKNIVLNLALQFVSYLVPLILAPYISRCLGAKGVGAYAYASSIVAYFVLVIGSGFSSYGTKRIAEHRDSKRLVSDTFGEIVVCRFFLFVVTLILYFIIVYGTSLTSEQDKRIYLVLVICMISAMIDPTVVFQGLERIKVFTIINIIVNIIYMVSIFLFIHDISDLIMYTLLKSCVQLVSFTGSYIYLREILIKPNIKYSEIIKTLKGGLVFFIPSMITRITPMIDQTMLGKMSSTMQVGYYEQANKIKILAASVVFAFAPIILSRVAYLHKNNNYKEADNKLTKIIYLSLYFLFPVVIGLYVISRYFFPMYFGKEFVNSVEVMYWLLPSLVFSSIATLLLDGGLYATDRINVATKALLVCDSINLVTNYLIIPRFGAKGAAFTSSFSNGLLLLWCVLSTKDFVSYREVIKRTYRILFSAVIMGMILGVTSNRLDVIGIPFLIIVIICILEGAMAYVVLNMLIKDELTLLFIKTIKELYGNN